MVRGCSYTTSEDVGGGRGQKLVKNWSKLPTDSTKKLSTWGRVGGDKNPEKLQMSFMDGPLGKQKSYISTFL